MGMLKTAAAGMIGFALGAGAMMTPESQKWKKQALRQMERITKMVKTW